MRFLPATQRERDRMTWFSQAAEKVRLGARIRVFDGSGAVWATVEDRAVRQHSITFTTNYGDFTFYRRTRMVLAKEQRS